MSKNIFEIKENQNPTSDNDRKKILTNPGFGSYFTDHMAVVSYNKEKGWHNAQITALNDLKVSPAMMALHYGQAIFEGMKAYRTPQNELVLFRPEKNAQRFNKSAQRLSMPELPEEYFIQACTELVRQDQKWVPEIEGQSLYLRPFMIASEAHLGLRAANEYLFIVIASPVAPFFAQDGQIPSISVFATDKYIRAAQGGTGYAKCAGNYAASLLAKEQAQEYDCQDVLWRDAKEQKYVEEMGTSNICFVKKNTSEIEIITPPISETILNGITRDSILTIAKDKGYKVTETPCVFNDITNQINNQEINEVFSCGTAVTITPIGSIITPDSKTIVGDSKAGEISLSLREELVDIQFGRIEDKHNWLHKI